MASQSETENTLPSSLESSTNTAPSTFTNAVSVKDTFCDVIASIFGSAACVYTGQPFDTVKVRLQVNAAKYQGSFIKCFQQTIANEGVIALWRGSLPALMGALSENMVAFATNGFLKRLLSSQSDDSFIKPILTGSITGAVSAIALCPCDILKCRAQVNIAKGLANQSLSTVIAGIWTKQGIAGFYQGFGSQLCRDIPFYGSFFGSYDILCRLLRKLELPEASVYFLAGGLAGQIGWIASIAPDTVKSRIQTSDNPQPFMKTARQIMLEGGGIRGLFAGVEVAIIRAFPANAALFVGYEFSRKTVGRLVGLPNT